MHFPSQFPAGNFFSRERDGKLEIAFPDFGKGNGIFQWEVKGNLRLVFLGIVGNGNFRSPLFWTDSVLRIWKNLGRPTSWSVCERLDGEHVASEASINSGSQSSQAGSSGSPPLGAIQGKPESPSFGILPRIPGSPSLGAGALPVNTSLTQHPFASLQANWTVYVFKPLILLIGSIFIKCQSNSTSHRIDVVTPLPSSPPEMIFQRRYRL